jgi:hypothetical protein
VLLEILEPRQIIRRKGLEVMEITIVGGKYE